MNDVILVNSKDQEIGTMEKLEAHQKGELHRAFSVLVYNSKGEMLLQKRADSKYHSGGLWTNACCSHPSPNESISDAAKRRLREELSIEGSPEYLYKFIYRIELDNNLIEHECDHVFEYTTDVQPALNQEEASDYKYMSLKDLFTDIDQHPENYTFWFKMIIENLKSKMLTC